MLVVILIADVLVAQWSGEAMAGEWLSSKKDSCVLIYKDGPINYGKITWVSGPVAKDDENAKTALRNGGLTGPVILQDFLIDLDNGWDDGCIYDRGKGKPIPVK